MAVAASASDVPRSACVARGCEWLQDGFGYGYGHGRGRNASRQLEEPEQGTYRYPRHRVRKARLADLAPGALAMAAAM